MLDPIEQEIQELFNRLRQEGPKPRQICGGEATQIIRFLRENPTVTEFASSGIERYLANAACLPDGRALLVHRGKPTRQAAHTFLPRGSAFGAYLKITTVTKAGPRCALLLPHSDPFSALHGGRVVMAFMRLGQLEDAFEFNYTSPSHIAALSRIVEITKLTEHELRQDPAVIPDVELLRAQSVGPYLGSFFSREDWLQVGWATEIGRMYETAVSSIKDRGSEAAAAIASGNLHDTPLMRAAFEILGSDRSAGKRLIDLLALFSDHKNAGQCLREMVFLSDRSPAPETSKAIWLCAWVWHTSALGAKATNWGRRQRTYSNFAGTFSAIPIDPSQFPITSDEEAREFWEQRAYTIPFDGHEYLSSGDFPANVGALADFWEAHPPAMDPDEAEASATRLLEEASALRKWTIPPRAMVDLKLGPFAAVEITEIGDEIYFVWRTGNERYWRCSVGVRRQRFDNVAPYGAPRRRVLPVEEESTQRVVD